MIDPAPFINALIGKDVSHVWRGCGSALFVEFGQLAPRRKINGKGSNNPTGELTLMIDWSWRIENPKSILCGSWSSKRKIDGMLKKILGAHVTAVEFIGYIPEIVISLSNGRRVVSFMSAEGQPDWALLTRNPSLGSLCVERGVLSVDSRNS